MYQCQQCGKQRYARDIAKGIFCKSCGSKFVMTLRPTWFRIVQFFFHNPQMLLVYVRENILHA